MTENNKPYTTQAEFKSWSLKDAEPVTMQGFWNPENAPWLVRSLQEPQQRNVVIQGESIHALGIDWWTWKTQFTATATANMGQASDGMVTASMDFTPTSQAVITKAEWWRRVGFYVIARPYDWLAEHSWRPWARWIVRDEVDEFEDED